MGKPKATTEVVLTGAVYCDWNAFSFVAPLPDPQYWRRGDIVVWSWSGDSKKPSSKSTGGLFAVSLITGVRKLRRSKLKVKRTRVHRNLPFCSERDREEQLATLVKELQALVGRAALKKRGGYEVVALPTAVNPPVLAAPQPKPVEPPKRAPEHPTPAGVRRGRLKPGIRSEAPAEVPVAPAAVATVVAVRAAAMKPKPRRRRPRKPNPNQGELF